MISDSSCSNRSARAASRSIVWRNARLLGRPVSSSVTACSETRSCSLMFSIDAAARSSRYRKTSRS